MRNQIGLLILFLLGYGTLIVGAGLYIYQALFPKSSFARWYHNSLFSSEGVDKFLRERKEKSGMKWR